MTIFLSLLDIYGLQRKIIREQESRPKAKIEIIYNYMFSFDQFMLERKSEAKLVTETIWAKLWIVSKRFGLIMTISVPNHVSEYQKNCRNHKAWIDNCGVHYSRTF